jgi:hypothetical protein
MAMAENSEAVAPDVSPNKTAEQPAAKKKVVKLPVKMKRVNTPSSISFPYRDLDSGIAVAQAIHNAGAVPLTTDQLAGVMGLQAGSGNYVLKVATARIFGLTVNNNGKVELTDVGFDIVDRDEKRQKAARAKAFLTVPLYRRVYDEFRGRSLPPKLGLEQAFVKFGVSAKQKEAARLAFEKSAAQAGFFAAGTDRLIEPIIGAASPRSDDTVVDDDPDRLARVQNTPPPPPASVAQEFHPFIQGLLDTLPEPNTNWTVEGRAKWLMAAANIFDLIYKGSGEITIVAKATETPKQ